MKEENNGYDIEQISVESASDIISGAGLMQTKAQYTTAIKVIQERNIEKVIAAVEKEAELAGEDFYYSYPQGGKYIEGTGIGGALILARNFRNCAVNSRPVETPTSIIVFADFVDFETGFNLTRAYIGKRKVLRNRSGKEIYDRDRNDEIVFQIMNSKAIRNVILNAIPNYIIDAGLKKAKTGMRKKLDLYIKNHGIEKAREIVVGRAGRLNIDNQLLEKQFGIISSWDADKIMRINGVLKGIEEGHQTVKDAFMIYDDEEKKNADDKNKPAEGKNKNSNTEIESAAIVKDAGKKSDSDKKSDQDKNQLFDDDSESKNKKKK